MMETKKITLTAIIAALYAALVIMLIPISYGPIQLRIADCLIPLSVIFGWPAILGVSLGAFIGNAYFMQFTGPIDVVFGTIANLLSAYAIYKLKDNLYFALPLGSLIVGGVVGGYLWIYFPSPPIMGLPIWLAMIISITLSSFIAIAILGGILITALKKRF